MIDYSNAEWVDPKFGWKPEAVTELPERVLIDFATKCNLRCPMCPVWGSDDNNAINSVKGVMQADAATRLLDEISPGPSSDPAEYVRRAAAGSQFTGTLGRHEGARHDDCPEHERSDA